MSLYYSIIIDDERKLINLVGPLTGDEENALVYVIARLRNNNRDFGRRSGAEINDINQNIDRDSIIAEELIANPGFSTDENLTYNYLINELNNL